MIELCMSNYEFANSSLFYSDCVLKNVIFKFFLQKKTYDEQKFDSKKTDGPVSSDLKSVKGSPRVSIHAENSLKSDGYYKRTDRKSRIIEKSGSASKPEFGFTRLDFPELQSPENSEIPKIQKQPKWGPLRSTSTDISLLREMGTPSAGLSEVSAASCSLFPSSFFSPQ